MFRYWLVFCTLLLLAMCSCNKELLEAEPDGYFTDPRDSLVYPYITIGQQTWMMRNMMHDSGAGSFAYNGEEKFVADYGRLYLFAQAARVCPDGWRLPTDKDWKELEIAVGMDPYSADSVGWRRDGDAGIALKNETGWYSGGNGSNTVGFSALPAGFRGLDERFYVFGDVVTFWTSSYASETHAWGRAMVYYEPGVYRWKYDKLEGYSVRCIQD